MAKRKIAIVGTGAVGATFAFAMMTQGTANEIVLINRSKEKAVGHALDLNHGLAFVHSTVVRATDYAACEGAHVIVIAAGLAQRPGQTRLDLAHANVAILKKLLREIVKYNDTAVFLLLANPVDILTHAALKITGLPENRIFGSGTVLDTSRFRYLISRACNVNVNDVHAFVIGEHGDSKVPVWSSATVGGIPAAQYYDAEKARIALGEDMKEFIDDMTGGSAGFIIELKGHTCYAISLAAVNVVESLFRDTNSIMTVSGRIEGAYGINGICLSLPCFVNSEGKSAPMEIPLAESEIARLVRSADILTDVIRRLRF